MLRLVIYLAALAGSPASLVGCGGSNEAPATPKPIDERRGTYLGVGLGDTPQEVTARFGPAPPWENDPVAPLDVADEDLAGRFRCSPPGKPSARTDVLRYEGSAFVIDRERVCHVSVIEDGAVTAAGVAIGDELENALRTYPQLECGRANPNDEAPSYPACYGDAAKGIDIWFGGDPITAIELDSTGFGAHFLGQAEIPGVPGSKLSDREREEAGAAWP